jgi:hypothetical protein
MVPLILANRTYVRFQRTQFQRTYRNQTTKPQNNNKTNHHSLFIITHTLCTPLRLSLILRPSYRRLIFSGSNSHGPSDALLLDVGFSVLYSRSIYYSTSWTGPPRGLDGIISSFVFELTNTTTSKFFEATAATPTITRQLVQVHRPVSK